jgi:hypothetical protein
LHLNVYAVLNIPGVSEGKDVQIVLKTYERKIVIEVGAVQRALSFLHDHWQWTFASLLIPVVSFVVDRLKQKGDDPTQNPRFVQRLRRRREGA